MPRLNRFEDVNFPVKIHPMFANVDNKSTKQRKSTVRIPGRNAIINMTNGDVVGVVSSGYHLVTNQKALEAAQQCCLQMFPETVLSEWNISTVDSPSTGSSCSIDLMHSTTNLEFDFVLTGARSEVPETFGPFIRVINSYNGQHALKFSIGFYRKTCANGLVGPQDIIRFQFDHTRSGLGKGIKFDIEHNRFNKMKEDFVNCFRDLHQCDLNQQQFRSLVASVLNLKKPKELQKSTQPTSTSRESKEWHELQNSIEELNQRYMEELGQNAYAVLNVLTEFASYVPENRYARRSRHSFQKLAGEWLISFHKARREPSFSVDDYLTTLDQDTQAKSVTHDRAPA